MGLFGNNKVISNEEYIELIRYKQKQEILKKVLMSDSRMFVDKNTIANVMGFNLGQEIQVVEIGKRR